MIVNEIFGFSKRSNRSSYTNNPYAVMSAPTEPPAEVPAAAEPAEVPAAEPAAAAEPAKVPAAEPAAAPESPSLELLKKATTSLQGGPALSAQELKQVNDYRVSTGAKPIPAQAQPAGFNASNVMNLPGMEKYAKPPVPAKAPNFAGPGGYGKVTTSFKPVTPAAPKVPVTPAAPKQPITIGGQKILPTDPAYDKIMGKTTVESLTWSKNFDPGMTLLRKMRK